MPRGRARSWSDDALRAAVASAGTLTEVVRTLGLRPAGGNHRSVRVHVARLALDTTHFAPAERRDGALRRARAERAWDAAAAFALAGRASRTLVRRRARRELRPYACALCGNDGTHRGAPLALQLDHVNGVADDHRLCNLRWLCPNCHAQTATFAGRASYQRPRTHVALESSIPSSPAPESRR